MTDLLRNEKIQLLQKLQKLASSDPSSEEAKTAALMAAQITEKYNLSICDLNEDGTLDATSIVEFQENSYSPDMIKWESLLLSGVSTAFDCECIRIDHGQTRLQPTLSIIGAKTDVELASWFFSSLHRRIGKITERHSRSKSRNQDYGIGIVRSVNDRLYEMKKEQVKTRRCSGPEGEETSSLVIAKIEEVRRECTKRYPGAKADGRRNTNPINNRSFLAGIQAGRGMSLSTPIKEGDPTQRLEIER